METTVTGKPITVALSFRVPLAIYREFVARAHAEGVTVSQLLRRVTRDGLGIELPEADREAKR